MQYNKDFAVFIEDLRNKRNIPREEFVKDVVSLRQYYRFIKGESSLNIDAVNALLEKLDANSIHIYTRYMNNNNKIRQNLLSIYESFRKGKISESREKLNTIQTDEILSTSNMQLYSVLDLIVSYESKSLTLKETTDRLKEIINYPEILEKDVFTFFEDTALKYINSYLIANDDFSCSNKLYDIFLTRKRENSSLSYEDIYNMISLIPGLGSREKYREANSLTNLALDSYLNISEVLVLGRIFAFKAVNEKKLSNDDRYKESLLKVFMCLKLNNNKREDKIMRDLIFEKFGLNESDLIEYKI